MDICSTREDELDIAEEPAAGPLADYVNQRSANALMNNKGALYLFPKRYSIHQLLPDAIKAKVSHENGGYLYS